MVMAVTEEQRVEAGRQAPGALPILVLGGPVQRH